MLSIVIPVYKEETYLLRTLKTLTSQTIIDDCEIILSEYNPDNSIYTRRLADDFYKKYGIPTRVINIPRPGIAHARNEGVLLSDGEYFINFDADARFNRKDALERISKPIINGTAALTICDNEFDYTGMSQDKLEDMIIPQQILDGLNKAQKLGVPILEPGSCFNKVAFVEVGGFNDVKMWELSIMTPRFVWKYSGMIKYISGISVIVSPRRAVKLKELGISTINYSKAIRGDKVVSI